MFTRFLTRLCLALPFLTGFFEAFSQDYAALQFSAMTAIHGLPSVECNFAFQDADDFMWIGTNEGLYRYDGYSFKGFDLLANTASRSLKFYNGTQNRAGTMAFATSEGVILFSADRNEMKIIEPDKHFDKKITNNIFSVAYDTQNRLWFGSSAGLFLYNEVTDSLIQFSSGTGIKEILCSKSGDIWISTWGNGLAKFNESDSTLSYFPLFTYSSKKKSHNVVYSLFEGADDMLWVGTWDGGLYALDISKPGCPVVKKWFAWDESSSNTITGDIIYDISADNYGNLWVGTPYGLSILKDPLSEKVSIYNYQANKSYQALSSNEVSSVIKDRTGVMWLATKGGGVNKVNINQIKFKPYSITEIDPQKKSQTVHGFTYDLKNRLLIGVQSLGFGSYDIQKELFVHFLEIPDYAPLKDININTVKNFTWDIDSNLWLGTRYHGLIKYNVRTGNYLMLKSETGDQRLPAVEIFFVKKDMNDALWASTNNGLFKILPGNDGSFNDFHVVKIHALNGKNISDLTFDRTGRVWIATFGGDLLKSREPLCNNATEPMKYMDVTNAAQETVMSITALFFDHAGELWIGSDNGLKIRERASGKLISPWPIEKMKGVKIYDITDDANGNILATSNKGLIQLKMDEDRYHINMYSARNGLQSNVFIKGALLHDKHKNLLIGGHNGFNYFNPLLIEGDTIVPKIAFTDLKNSEKVYNPNVYNADHPFIISYDNNLFTISFASLDFRNPGNTRYAYKLEGLDSEWLTVSANSRTATYVNLKPGNYTFKVMGTSAMGKWSEQTTNLPIFVTTAPYLTAWAYLLYILTGLGIIILIFLMYRNQMKAKQALREEHIERTKSEKLNQFKLQFFTNLSHELLTPLSILLIISEKWDEYRQFTDKKISRMLERNVHKLHQHIKQMLQFRKAETGNMTLDPKEQDLKPVVQDLIDNYKLVASEKNMNFTVDVPEEVQGCFDSGKVDICLNNLLSNAFKYTGKGGNVGLQVKSTVRLNQKWVSFIVSDDGEGIPEEGLENIFNRFYRLSGHARFQDGLGIGLALTRNLVDLQGGNISVESSVGEGSVFTMDIPVCCPYTQDDTLTKNDPLIAEDKIDEDLTELLGINFDHLSMDLKKRKTILIIEDNEDFLILVMMYLKKYYNVITCTNGKEALELANDHEIDLMVSDLMLPEMDGYKLCKSIKSTVNTSHIPFIIVTARANDHERLLGYKSGVDSYLTKPVNMKVLISRIESLLKSREQIRNDFSNGVFLEPKKVVTTSIDEDILTRAKEIVEAHISDPEFTVRVLCDELAMSNSMLYRKIKGILNLTPNDFIKNIRLRRAAQLLEDKNINISEVAYQTGFNDLSYFGVCFKKQYGVTPTVYQKELEVKHGKQELNYQTFIL